MGSHHLLWLCCCTNSQLGPQGLCTSGSTSFSKLIPSYVLPCLNYTKPKVSPFHVQMPHNTELQLQSLLVLRKALCRPSMWVAMPLGSVCYSRMPLMREGALPRTEGLLTTG